MSNQRSRIVIEPTVQWALVRRMMLHWGLFLVSMISFGTLLNVLMNIGTLRPGEAVIKSFREHLPTLVVAVVLLPIFLRDSLRLSLRFAGPVYRMRSALKDLANGETGRPIRFREGDFWGDLAGDLNEIRQRLIASNQSQKTTAGKQDAF